MSVYYNEWDSKAAAWLRELIRRGCIPDGEVDERSILDVDEVDFWGFTSDQALLMSSSCDPEVYGMLDTTPIPFPATYYWPLTGIFQGEENQVYGRLQELDPLHTIRILWGHEGSIYRTFLCLNRVRFSLGFSVDIWPLAEVFFGGMSGWTLLLKPFYIHQSITTYFPVLAQEVFWFHKYDSYGGLQAQKGQSFYSAFLCIFDCSISCEYGNPACRFHIQRTSGLGQRFACHVYT